MKKGYFLIGIIVLSLILVFSGCGVAQEEYDAVVAERDAAQAEVDNLADDLEAALAEADSLANDLEAALAEADSLADDLEAALAEADSLADDLEAAQTEADSLADDLSTVQGELSDLESELTSTLTPLIGRIDLSLRLLEMENLNSKAELGMISLAELNSESLLFLLSLEGLIENADDDELSQHWDEFWEACEQMQEDQAALCFIELYDRLLELLAEDIEAIEPLVD